MEHELQPVIDSIKEASKDISERIESKLDGHMIFSKQRFDQHEREEWSMFDETHKRSNEHMDKVNSIFLMLEEKIVANERHISEAFAKIKSTEWKVWLSLGLCTILIIYNFLSVWIHN